MVQNTQYKIDLKNLTPGHITYFYVGHDVIDMDDLEDEPTIGFLCKSNIFENLKLTSEKSNPDLITVFNYLEHNGDIGYFSFTKGDHLLVINKDLLQFYCIVKIVVAETPGGA